MTDFCRNVHRVSFTVLVVTELVISCKRDPVYV